MQRKPCPTAWAATAITRTAPEARPSRRGRSQGAPGSHSGHSWLKLWQNNGASGGEELDKATDPAERAAQFAKFAVRTTAARRLAPAAAGSGTQTRLEARRDEHPRAYGTWMHAHLLKTSADAQTLRRVRACSPPCVKVRMEEGLCRLAAVAVTQRALANVKKRRARARSAPRAANTPATPALMRRASAAVWADPRVR